MEGPNVPFNLLHYVSVTKCGTVHTPCKEQVQSTEGRRGRGGLVQGRDQTVLLSITVFSYVGVFGQQRSFIDRLNKVFQNEDTSNYLNYS